LTHLILELDHDRQSDDSKAAVERVQRGLDTLAQLHKQWDQRLTFERPDFLERYLDGGI